MSAAVAAILAQCYPFNQLDVTEVEPYLSRMDRRQCKRGQALLKNHARGDGQLTYLVKGTAELRRSFFDRQPLMAGDVAALQPLDHLLTGDGGQIIAVEECEAVCVPRVLLDELQQLSAQRSRLVDGALHGRSVFMPGDVVDVNQYGVQPLTEADFSEEFLVSDAEVAVDWMSRFLQLPLTNNLPASTIQQLLACLRSDDVAKGDAIIRRGEMGDAMFVLTRGVASVRTDSDSALSGREIPLIPGDYFGEESIVADSVRNATVVMESDGSVARLDREAFMELIYPHLVPTADAKLANAPHEHSVQLLDVRFPVEFRRNALAGSRNLPISELRAAMPSLSAEQPVLVAPCGGRRSELAVFLLRQAGFNAYVLPA
jgi:rhodanese-related sulfurtransferase